MRRCLPLVVLLATLVVVAIPASPAWAIHAGRACGSVGGYKLRAINVGCVFARRWAPRSWYRPHRRPSGYRCSYGSLRSTIRMYCYSGSRGYYLRR